MTKRVEAIYEDGVLKPLEPVNLPEHQRVTVTLNAPEEDWLDTEFMDSCAAEVKERVGLDEVRRILSKVPDSLAEAIVAERDGL
jgi:predicted DNA-binding antitoxin AbrB/MazE fold protein